MKILAIETSCDETAIALLEVSGELRSPTIKILGDTLLSQAKLHEAYGGVYPNLAKREHEKNLPILLEQTLKEANEAIEAPKLDFIAVTTGPGLEPALWTGITFAEGLGRKWDKPVIPVNHMEGHIYSVLASLKPGESLELPALALLISGGHTELVYVKDFGVYEMLGQTLDDAVGEAFDKVARMLGLPYPGGPEISRLAEKRRKELGREFPDAGREQASSFRLPRPMIHSKDLNFSFSGLKTAVLYKVKADNRHDDEYKQDMAQAFEDAVAEVLTKKTRQALDKYPDIRTLIVSGGVSANSFIQKQFAKLIESYPQVTLRIPERTMATDNAIMIGLAGYVRAETQPELLKSDTTLKAEGKLTLTSSRP